MIPKKRELKKISKWFWEQGPGSKAELSRQLKMKPSQITRMLKGGTISQEKFDAIKEVVDAA